GAFSARSRHVVALERAGAHLTAARAAAPMASPELVAEDLRAAQQALGEITGAFTTEDLLGAIFSTFCIGK
ncbi:MAG: tRNA uridine-5-carboxymethylaminomethyl(34) synthesis GTPase MnmE, partial [Rhodanobacteraceae bacterium]